MDLSPVAEEHWYLSPLGGRDPNRLRTWVDVLHEPTLSSKDDDLTCRGKCIQRKFANFVLLMAHREHLGALKRGIEVVCRRDVLSRGRKDEFPGWHLLDDLVSG